MSDVCQFCMAGTVGAQKAQLVLYEGSWQPWPLVAPMPDDVPVILCDICPGCDRERFNEQEVPRLNQKIAERNQRASA